MAFFNQMDLGAVLAGCDLEEKQVVFNCKYDAGMSVPVQIIVEVSVFLEESFKHFLQVEGSELSVSFAEHNLFQVDFKPLILSQTNNLVSFRAFNSPKRHLFCLLT